MSAVTLSSPVAEAWSQSEQLVSRASRGKLVVCSNDCIGREDLIPNEEVISPVLATLGLRTTVDCIYEHVEMFMHWARPRGKGSLNRGLVRVEAWKIKRLVSVFSRSAKRGHYPRECVIRRIYEAAGIPLPAKACSREASSDHDDGYDSESDESSCPTTDCEVDAEMDAELDDTTDCGGALEVADHMAALSLGAGATPSEVTATPCPSPRGSPAMDLPSTEKVYKHDVTYQEGSFECKTCGTIASTMDAITSQPCTRRGISGEVPGKSGDCMCQLIEFSFDWPTKVQEPSAESPKRFADMHCTGTTLELLPTEVPAHPPAPEEPKLPEPGVSNPAVVREVMGWGLNKEEAIAKAIEIQNRKQQEEEIKECDVKVSESKVKEEVGESEECESKRLNEEAEPAKESALDNRPAVLDCLPHLSPKEQVENMRGAGGRGRGRGKGKGKGRGAKAKRKHSSDDSGEESSSEDEEVEEAKMAKSSKKTEKAVAKRRARSKKAEKTEEKAAEGEAYDGKPKKTKGKGFGDKKPEAEDGKKKRGKKAEGEEIPQTEDGKKKTRGKTTKGEKNPETEEGKHEEKTDEKKAKRKTRSKKAAVNKDEEDHEEKTADEKKNGSMTDRKKKRVAETGSTRLKKSKGQETKDPENAKNEKAEKKTRKRKKDDAENDDDAENETEQQKLEKERKAERSRKSSAYCAARKKALEDGLNEAEAKEKGREAYKSCS